MKRFAWPLERLLEVAHRREEAQKAELARLAGEAARQRREIARRQAVIRSALADLGAQPAAHRLPRQRLFMDFAGGEIRRIEQMREELVRLEQRRREELERLAGLRKERRKLEQLRETAWQDYQRELALWEQKQLDEAAQIGFVRKAQAVAEAVAPD